MEKSWKTFCLTAVIVGGGMFFAGLLFLPFQLSNGLGLYWQSGLSDVLDQILF